MTLTDFLLARIAEDETEAESATAGPWEVDDPSVLAVKSMGSVVATFAIRRADRDFSARHHPARVLAECEAKRRIVELFEVGDDMWGAMQCLADVYADHPDYREEWKP